MLGVESILKLPCDDSTPYLHKENSLVKNSGHYISVVADWSICTVISQQQLFLSK